MQTAEELATPSTATQSLPSGGILRCEPRRLNSGSSRTKARVSDDVAEQSARRLGTLAILTAVSVVATTVAKHLLQPELAAAQATPLFRLSALFLVLSSLALAALQRKGSIAPQALLDLGLIFEVGGSFAIAAM